LDNLISSAQAVLFNRQQINAGAVQGSVKWSIHELSFLCFYCNDKAKCPAEAWYIFAGGSVFDASAFDASPFDAYA
jgi:hypothetical protein